MHISSEMLLGNYSHFFCSLSPKTWSINCVWPPPSPPPLSSLWFYAMCIHCHWFNSFLHFSFGKLHLKILCGHIKEFKMMRIKQLASFGVGFQCVLFSSRQFSIFRWSKTVFCRLCLHNELHTNITPQKLKKIIIDYGNLSFASVICLK